MVGPIIGGFLLAILSSMVVLTGQCRLNALVDVALALPQTSVLCFRFIVLCKSGFQLTAHLLNLRDKGSYSVMWGVAANPQ